MGDVVIFYRKTRDSIIYGKDIKCLKSQPHWLDQGEEFLGTIFSREGAHPDLKKTMKKTLALVRECALLFFLTI